MLRCLIPYCLAKNVYEIDSNFYCKNNIKTIVFDLDNTLDAYYTLVPSPKAIELINSLKNDGFNVVIISNNTKPRVERYCKELDCKYIYGARKPFVLKAKRFFKKNRINPSECICIGDQVFTDVLFSSKVGMKCILCENLVVKDQFFTKINKFFDQYIRKRIIKKGLAKSWEDM